MKLFQLHTHTAIGGCICLHIHIHHLSAPPSLLFLSDRILINLSPPPLHHFCIIISTFSYFLQKLIPHKFSVLEFFVLISQYDSYTLPSSSPSLHLFTLLGKFYLENIHECSGFFLSSLLCFFSSSLTPLRPHRRDVNTSSPNTAHTHTPSIPPSPSGRKSCYFIFFSVCRTSRCHGDVCLRKWRFCRLIMWQLPGYCPLSNITHSPLASSL